MEDLLKEYSETVRGIYKRTKSIEKDTDRYKLLFTEYQELCIVKRMIMSYCKLKEDEKKERYVLQIKKISYNKSVKR